MVQKSYFYFLKERFFLFTLFLSFYVIFYCLTRSYGLAKPAVLTIPGAIFVAVFSLTFLLGGAMYQFLTQE